MGHKQEGISESLHSEKTWRGLVILGIGIASLVCVGLGLGLALLWAKQGNPSTGLIIADPSTTSTPGPLSLTPFPTLDATISPTKISDAEPLPVSPIPATLLASLTLPTSTKLPPPSATLTPEPDYPLPEYDLAFSSNRDGDFSVILMNSRDPKQWLTLPAPVGYEYNYWPSFCGNLVVFEVNDHSSTLDRWIYQVDLETKGLAKYEPPVDLKADRLAAPGCSPSNRFIALSARRESNWFFTIIDQEKGQAIYETSWERYLMLGFPSWTASEDLLYWMGALDTGYFDINETSRGGSNVTSNLVLKGKYPAISPDGKLLAYFCGNLSSLCIAEMPSGKKLFDKTVSYFREIDGKPVPASAAWSADGEWLYFSSSIVGHWDIYRIRRDGSDLQNLTEAWPSSDELMPATR
jgi:hypothetical protein